MVGMVCAPIGFMTSLRRLSARAVSISTASSTISVLRVSVPCSSHLATSSSAYRVARWRSWRSLAPRSREYASKALSMMASLCDPSSHCMSLAGSPTRRSCQPSTPVTLPSCCRNESAASEPLITVGWNCQSLASSAARSHRPSRAAGTSPVAAARSITVTQERRHSPAVMTGSPASATKLVGRPWIAAIARPTDAASESGPAVYESSGVFVP